MNHRNVPNAATAYGLKRLRAGRAQWKTNPAFNNRKNLNYLATIVIAFTIAVGILIKYLLFDSGAF